MYKGNGNPIDWLNLGQESNIVEIVETKYGFTFSGGYKGEHMRNLRFWHEVFSSFGGNEACQKKSFRLLSPGHSDPGHSIPLEPELD
jgi:hypothetical protein